MKQSHGSALLAKKVVAEKLENVIRDSIVASIPACHAGDRGSIPRRGGSIFYLPSTASRVCIPDLRYSCHTWSTHLEHV